MGKALVLAVLAFVAIQFRATTDLVLIDVTVVDKGSAPVVDLGAADFEVRVDGIPRSVVSATLVRSSGVSPDAAAGDGRGRVFVLAIDQGSYPALGEQAARDAAKRLISLLTPDDYLGFLPFPSSIAVAPTRDHEEVRSHLVSIHGTSALPAARQPVSASESFGFKSHDTILIERVHDRLCPRIPSSRGILPSDPNHDAACVVELEAKATSLAVQIERQTAQTFNGITALLLRVAAIPGRKILVLISAGAASSERPDGGPDLAGQIKAASRLASEANAVLYVVYTDAPFLKNFIQSNGAFSVYDDSEIFGHGLSQIAAASGGAIFRVGYDPDRQVTRLLQETEAHYLIAIAAVAADRDSRPHELRVKVNRSGAQVRSRTTMTIPR